MPHRYYTLGAGPVRLFALDTDEGTAGKLFFKQAWSDAQAQWLDSALATAGPATWKIVYGHHPIFSDGHHGDSSRLRKKLLPILEKHKVDVVLSGHDHDLQHHQVNGIEFFVVGGGGKDTRAIRARRPQTKFVAASHGFMEIEATVKQMVLRLRGTDGRVLHERKLNR
jgi:3',5'-cyclic AMP phosphodiesterase CpdA